MWAGITAGWRNDEYAAFGVDHSAVGGDRVHGVCLTFCQREGLSMFQVVHKETGEIRTVYAVTGNYFMVWNEQEACWDYDAMRNYKPVADCAASPA